MNSTATMRQRAVRADSAVLVRRLFDEAWNQDNDATLVELVARDYRHWKERDRVPARGPAALRTIIHGYKRVIPDLEMTIVEQRCWGDRVTTRWLARGTHTGISGTLRPTGRAVTLGGTFAARVVGGKLVEGRGSWDGRDLTDLLGADPHTILDRPVAAHPAMDFRISGTGHGVPIVMIPPGPLPGWIGWRRVTELLAGTRTVMNVQPLAVEYAFDERPPTDDYAVQSESDALARSLELAGLPAPYDIVAWSTAGIIALDFVLANPARVRSLTLVEPACYWVLHARGPLDDDVAEKARLMVAGFSQYITLAALEQHIRDVKLFPPEFPFRAEWKHWPLVATYRQALRYRPAMAEHRDDPERVRALDVPVLMVQGTESHPAYHKIAAELIRLLPDVRNVDMPGGHGPHMNTGASRFVAEVLDFHAAVARTGA